MTIQELLAQWNCPDDLAFQAATLFDKRLAEFERRLAAMERTQGEVTRVGYDDPPSQEISEEAKRIIEEEATKMVAAAERKPRTGKEWRERHKKQPWYVASAKGYGYSSRENHHCDATNRLPDHIFNAMTANAAQSEEAINAILDAALLACEEIEPQAEPPASGLTALAAKWREASDDVHCGTLAERKILRRCADEMEAALRGVK